MIKSVNILASLFLGFSILAVSLSGCTEKELEASVYEDGAGCLKVQVELPRTKSYNALDYSTVRIYSISRSTGGEVVENLVRRYKPASSIPADLYLVAGEYKITVDAGTGIEATFTDKTYYGEESFVLEANKTKTVKVDCKITNVVVKVVFDETVKSAFDEGYAVYVSAADEFSMEDIENNAVPALEYIQDGTGYFILPDNVSNISWGFAGHSSDDAVAQKGNKAGVIESPQPGMQYTLTYKYSPDADGCLSMSVQMKEYESLHEDSFVFSPQPVVSGDGFDFGSVVPFHGEDLKMSISAINPLAEISFTVGDQSFTAMSSGVESGSNAENGIELSVTDEYNAVLALGQEFFSNIAGGIKTFELKVTDTGNGETSAVADLAVPGASGLIPKDLWYGTAELNAVVTAQDDADLKIRYRESSSDVWTEVALAKSETDYVYTAEGAGFTVGKSYDIQVTAAGAEYGKMMDAETEAGVQMPNAGFEEWHQSGKPWYPYAQGGTEFWGTGNPGATSIGEEYNLTTSSTDIRPGSSGKLSARLETKKPNVMGIGKLAAGNIFVGAFGEVSGMGGTVNMGREFTFNARPKALRVWYKYTPAGSDKGRIFICLVNMTNGGTYHVVNTNKPEATTFDPGDEFLYSDKTNSQTLEGHVIGYGDMMLETSVPEWTEAEIEIKYRDQYNEEKPNVLMVTASASYRGDYFEGEVGSLMYLDDIEFVY